MMNYKCIEDICFEKYDDDGFLIENKYFICEKGSIWHIDDNQKNILGGEIRLENSGLAWIEMSKDTFHKNFVRLNTSNGKIND